MGPDPRICVFQHERGGWIFSVFNDLLDNLFHFHLPQQISQPIFEEGQRTGAWFNLPAFIVLMVLSYVLVRGVRESAQTNNTMVVIKIVAILLFVFGAAHAVNTGNWHPFMPNGYSGVLSGGAIVFFTYIGFDSVSTAAEECGSPQRDMPIGIFATLLVCALLYGSVALVLTGIANWSTLNNDAPVANALKMIGMNRLRLIVTAGALLGMLSSLLVFQYGQARIWFAMSRDRLLPDSSRACIRATARRTSAPGWLVSWLGFRPASSMSAGSPISQTLGHYSPSFSSRRALSCCARNNPTAREVFACPWSRFCRESPSSAVWC